MSFRSALALCLALSLPMPALASPQKPLDRTISVSISDMPLQDAIRLVAQKGRLNLVIEDDLRSSVNVEFKDVRLGDALETLFAMGGAQAVWRGNVFAVIGKKKAYERGLLSNNARLFKLRYASATKVAEFLNTSALTSAYSGGLNNQNTTQHQQLELAKADPRTNSVLVFGTSGDLLLAERTIESLDQPIEHRIFKLSHANAVQVASVLNATIFNNGNKATTTETVRADVESITEGTGANNANTGVEIGNSQSGVRTRTLQTQALPVEAKQSVAVPDTRTNSVVVTGSAETLRLAQAMIPELDQPLRQVAIDVELVELSTLDAHELGVALSGANGNISSSFDPASANPSWSVSYDPAIVSPATFRARLNALVQDRKARILAHPTIMASDNTESQINIVDEVIKGTKITNQTVTVSNQSFVVVEPIFGAAGVTLNILPKIGADGTVTLRLHPTVSTIRETQRDGANNTISLLSRRELVTQQVTVPSGGSLTLGGLTQNTQISTRNKFPILGDIPLIGALFSSTANETRQTELMIVVTPKVQP